MTDLTKITTPYGLLDPETQEALRNCGGPWEFYVGDDVGAWEFMESRPSFIAEYAYRKAPQPVTYPKIPWAHVDDKWQFWARDEDGKCMFYECHPETAGNFWVCDLDFARSDTLKLDPGTCDWRDSLVERPK